MDSNSKLPVTVLFTIALLTGFISIAYTQSVHAMSIDPNGLPGIADNPAFDLLKGKGIKGDTKTTGSAAALSGPKDSNGDKVNKGDIAVPNSLSQAEKGMKFGHLTVKVHTVDSFNQLEPIQSSDFTVSVSGNQQSPDTFPGSESGTDVKVGFGNYQVTEDVPDNSNIGGGHMSIHFSQDCSGTMHNGEDKTCTITNTIR
jgi:hypothetical protein